MNVRSFRRAPARRNRQGGIVLFIALIVLVAMSLAGIAMVRSVDTSLGIAGNMAFKQSTVLGADKGVATAFTWLAANSSGTTLQASDTLNGYYAAAPADSSAGYWFDDSNWTIGTSAVALNGGAPDAAGNVIRYVIHRMCVIGGPRDATGNSCATYATSAATAGGNYAVGATQFVGTTQVYFRITVRVDGPRNTISVIQASVLFDSA